LRLKLIILLILWMSTSMGVAWASPPDPFGTEEKTPTSPFTYWPKPPDLKVNNTTMLQTDALLPDRPMTLYEVTDFALRNSPTTRLAWYQAKAAAAAVGIAESAYLPTIDAGYSADFSAVIFSSPHHSQTVYGPNFSFNYLLLDFGFRYNTLQAAKFQQIAANLTQNNAIQEVVLQVQQAYYQVLGNQAVVSANKISLEQAKISLDVSKALHVNGLNTIGDVYQAEASYAQAHLNLETSQGAYQTSLGQLATAMGMTANQNIQLVPLRPPAQIEKINKTVNQLLAQAELNRPDLLSAEAQVRQNQANLAATKASVLPQLTIQSTVAPGGFFSNTLQTTTSSVLTLSMPLFTGFSYTYQVRQAEAQLDASVATRDQLNQQIQFQVWQAYFALLTAAENITTSQILLKSALQASNQAVGQYKSGVGDILTVLTTQSTLATARVQVIQAQLNWYVALAQLAAAIGSLTGPTAKDLPL
jgi:outer membrane protein